MDAIIARIKKLLSLASNNPNAEEAALAAAEAQRLMLRHQIETVDLSDGPPPVEQVDVQAASGKCRAVMWQAQLAAVLGRHMHAEVSYTPGTDRIRAIGRATDVAALCLLYHHLRAQLERAAEAAWDGLSRSYRTAVDGGKVRWVDTFHRGAREAIDERMRAQREEAAEDQRRAALAAGATAEGAALVRTGALVRLDDYAREARSAISAFKAANGVRIRSTTHYARSAGTDALEAGRAAGRSASLRPDSRSLPGR